MGIGTAILGAAVIGGGASLIAGKKSSDAAKSAANTQAAAAQQGIQVQRDAITQSRIDAYPWALAGASALDAYGKAIGIAMPVNALLPNLASGPFGVGGTGGTALGGGGNALGGANRTTTLQDWYGKYLGRRASDSEINNWSSGAWGTFPSESDIANSSEARSFKQRGGTPLPPLGSTPAATTPGAGNTAGIPMTKALGFQETPGYQYAVDQAEKGVVNNLGALGIRNSGRALKALSEVRMGMANQQYDTWLNRLQGAAGMGQTQVNNNNAMLQNGANSVAQGMQNAGDARASGYVNSADAWGTALGGVSKAAGNALGQWAYYNA